MTEPTLHDIARGTTGCGDDDDPDVGYAFDIPEPFTIECAHNSIARCEETVPWCIDCHSYVYPVAVNREAWADYLSRTHVHDAGCNGTLEHSEEVLCGFPGSTGHIYCGVRPSLNGGCS